MVSTRAQKIVGIAETIPLLEVFGDDSGDLLVIGWGSTYGVITTAVEQCREKEMKVSSIHLRYLEPMPKNLGDILARFGRIMVPEINRGQLLGRLRDRFPVEAEGLSKVRGVPFMIGEIASKIDELLNGRKP